MNIWQSDRTPSSSFLNVAAKVAYFTMHLSYLITIFIGLSMCDDDEFVFQIAVLMAYSVINVKLFYILRYQMEIFSFLRDLCSHSVSDQNESIRINGKLNVFVEFVTTFLLLASSGTVPFFCFRLPIFTNTRKLPLTIGFPLNWRTNQWSYWAAYFFISLNHVLTVVFMSSSVIIWYIMINCSIKYELLGSQFRKIGATNDEQISESERKKLYLREFIGLIGKYQELRK